MSIKKAFATYVADKRSEPDLREYFVITDSVLQIMKDTNICAISGLKGMGKTATYRLLTEFETDIDIVIDISAENYSLSLSSRNLRAVPYSHEFEYEIVIEFLKKVVECKKIHKKLNKSLLDSAKAHVTTFMKDLMELGGRVNGISVLGVGFTLSDETKILVGLRGKKDEIAALDTLRLICDSGIKMRLVIDDPEEVFFIDRNLDVYLLGGLWLAIARINSLHKNLRAFVLMKTHVYDYVKSNTADLDKFPNSYKSICWDTNSLKKLIKSRMIYFLSCNEATWENTLFGKQVSKAKKDKIYEYIICGIRGGPRELLYWLYSALTFNEEKHLDYLNLKALEATYGNLSKQSFDHFKATNNEQYQDIGNLVQIIFSKSEDMQFTKAEFIDHIKQLQMKNEDYQKLTRSQKWLQAMVSNEVPELLFRVGAINLIDSVDIYPYMCNYTSDNFYRINRLRLTPVFKNYFKMY